MVNTTIHLSHGKFRSHKHLFSNCYRIEPARNVLTRIEETTQQTNNYTNTDSVKNFITGKSFLQRLQILLLIGIIVKFSQDKRDF